MKGQTQAVSNATVGIDLHPDSFAAAVTTGSTVRNIQIVQSFTKIPAIQRCDNPAGVNPEAC